MIWSTSALSRAIISDPFKSAIIIAIDARGRVEILTFALIAITGYNYSIVKPTSLAFIYNYIIKLGLVLFI
jgi:hypothetical protein